MIECLKGRVRDQQSSRSEKLQSVDQCQCSETSCTYYRQLLALALLSSHRAKRQGPGASWSLYFKGTVLRPLRKTLLSCKRYLLTTISSFFFSKCFQKRGQVDGRCCPEQTVNSPGCVELLRQTFSWRISMGLASSQAHTLSLPEATQHLV